MSPDGYLALVLHAHLPFVRHPEHAEFLEEKWLFEALTESYLPLLAVFDQLERDAVDFRVTLGLTPTLTTMLEDDLLKERYRRHLGRLLELAQRETRRLLRSSSPGRTARFYAERFGALRDNYERLDGDVVGAFRGFQDRGRVEVITSAATHAYLPHLRGVPSSIQAQIDVGVENYRRSFGRDPQGFWLPECAYFPGLDRFLASRGIQFFLLESHGLIHADRGAERSIFAPVVCPSGVAAFGRDPETSRLVWSSKLGYPGDPQYRDFYKDIGFDLPRESLEDALGPEGLRVHTGIKYHRVTGDTPHKEVYERERALERVDEHARDFVSRLRDRVGGLSDSLDRRALLVAPYDAELFGHWWFEGPEWIDRVLRLLDTESEPVSTATLSEYLAEYPSAQLSTPAESSWGDGGYHEIWLNEENDATCARLVRAARRMERLAERHPAARGDLRRALDQAARELLLAQASDWPFLQRTGTAPDYARRKSVEHLDRFEAVAEIVDLEARGEVSEAARRDLVEIESRDAIFPWIDYSVFTAVGRSGNGAGAARSVVEGRLRSTPRTDSVERRRVVFLSAEAAPYAKAGGLGDVAGALPAALARSGAEVCLLIPAYRAIDRDRFAIRLVRDDLSAWVGGRQEPFRLLEAKSPAPGVRVLLIDHPGYFDREGIYVDPATGVDYPDTAERFVFYCRAALETLSQLGTPVDVLHCHDHQTALALALRRLDYRQDPVLGDAAGILTLHNLGYQGVYPPELLDFAGIDRGWFYPGSPFEYYDHVNLMKIGIILADKVNAVSERYAREICESTELGAGLEGVLLDRGDDLVGILNGCDVDEWNPATDPCLPAPYSASDLSGKRQAKRSLRKALGLDGDRVDGTPLVGMVTRLVDQKGLDIFEEGLDRLMALGIDIVVLGTGLEKYHEMLTVAAARYPGRLAASLRFDNTLAHLIEAGSDMFLMPSLYEPCGLNQMYSLRYGTVPVVRHTGGLADTVNDDDDEPGLGVGFSFHKYTSEALIDAMKRAVRAYRDPERWTAIVKRGMAIDFSWEASAGKYLELYEEALERRLTNDPV